MLKLLKSNFHLKHNANKYLAISIVAFKLCRMSNFKPLLKVKRCKIATWYFVWVLPSLHKCQYFHGRCAEANWFQLVSSDFKMDILASLLTVLVLITSVVNGGLLDALRNIDFSSPSFMRFNLPEGKWTLGKKFEATFSCSLISFQH